MGDGAGRSSGRRRPSSEEVRASLWFWPAVGAGTAFLVALLLLRVRPEPASGLAERTWPGDASSATALLQTVATASVTAASLTFSLTVVALQLASQQFSPRLLRSFARDWQVQAAMAVLVSAFVVSLTTLRGLDPERPLPVLALLLSLLLGLAAAVVLVAFVAHIVRRLRVHTMMESVHHDTVASIGTAYHPYGEGPEAPSPDLPGPAGGVLVPAWSSGFVSVVRPEPLVAAARRHDVVLLLGVRPGDAVVQGAPVASAFAPPGRGVPVEDLARDLAEAVVLRFERTEEQDVAFGLRQLTDIALKAVSPAVNDPTTAAEALGYCADLLVRLQGRRLGPQVVRDEGGAVRAVLPDRDLRYYLDLVCAQVRRSGRSEPVVLTALLRLLRDTAVAARDEDQRRDVADQAALVLAQLGDDVLAQDAAAVQDLHRRVGLALAGDVDAAYRDRAGETRSI
ncbi:DUF2254 domain-containing protein [Vallicoccus soli]|uniref:DUF2254 domain-containing protein n=1 Tax=Vallicoccus soli TaxID=2339232 RepID=UPI0014020D94|nr:DUF2254 domain-containing protein [Vallicoccus soli]